ncbi:MAG TPA: lysylphosphatidylglycerol synthase transmembrane domain-containing protein [Acidimicrobiia bacterium]|nr:lysylphosphatidylglycerol synthase transmembrane domain-containing protein [Acidimicrobiia bacterium]
MTEAVPVPRRSGSRWKLAARIAVSVTLLALVAWKASDVDNAIPDQHNALTLSLLAAAVAMALLGVVLSAWRWQRVLLLFDARIRIGTLFSHYVVGLLVGNVLPSTIGGDVVRIARASNTIGSSEASFASVALERLTGFVALPLLVFAGFVISPSLIDHAHAWIALLIAVVALVLLLLILVAAGHPRLAGRFAERESWARFVGAVHLGVGRLRHEPGQIAPILGTSIVFQLSQVAMFGLIFRALALDVPVAAVVAFTPAVLMLQVLPISFSGVGVREAALLLFFHSFGVSATQAGAAGLLWWGCMIAVSMLGAPAFAVGQRSSSAANSKESV